MAPIDALRAWMLLFVDYMAAKQIIAPALNTLIGGPSKVFESTGHLIKGAIHRLVKCAIESGDMRSDLDRLDLLRALIGFSNVASTPDWPQSARRLAHPHGRFAAVDLMCLVQGPRCRGMARCEIRAR